MYTEKTIGSKPLFSGKVINLRKDTVTLPNGQTATREVVEHPGGVSIVAQKEDGKVLLVRQYRRPFDKEMIEIPAGKLEYGEDHYTCGLRELQEETGYKAGNYQYLGGFYPTPGFCNEIIHIYFASELTKGEMHLDEDEFLDVIEADVDKVFAMIETGEITDGKTIIGILLSKQRGYLK